MNSRGQPRCAKCARGYTDTYRLIVRNQAESTRRHLFHAHRDDNLQNILISLCQEFPNDWFLETVYFFYIDVGGSYYAVEHAFWLRDKDNVLITTVEDPGQLPDVSMNAIHASLREDVELQPHQEEGVYRMISMEKSYRGGILADDMGLGKTLQMLSLIMRQQPKLNVRACTLVVVPSRGVAEQWAEEIRTKTTYGSLPHFIYGEETLTLIDQPIFRIVITTYDRIRSEYRNREMTGKPSPLIDQDWFRIVLDESNKIRTMHSKVTESVLELRTRYRWCLTGTPLQNNISELYPIFAFLEIPLSTKYKHDPAYMSTMLKQHMVRRTKKSLQDALTILPQRENRVVLEFTEAERALYDYLERVLYKQISDWRKHAQNDNGRTIAGILYLRLKQTCGHFRILLGKFPNLIPLMESNQEAALRELGTVDESEQRRMERYSAQDEENELHEVMDIIETYYDEEALEAQENNLSSSNSNGTEGNSDPQNEPLEAFPVDVGALQELFYREHSTKIAWLIQFLQTTTRHNRGEKVVVVTQFLDLLYIISDVLAKISIKHITYHGEMSTTARTVALRQFNHDDDVRVMLLTLKAGGVGLNLQRANHMVILDRWQRNVGLIEITRESFLATMEQAIARIHRMTQSKQTFIHTIIMKDTIEEGLMDNILKKKSELFRTVVDDEDDDVMSDDEGVAMMN